MRHKNRIVTIIQLSFLAPLAFLAAQAGAAEQDNIPIHFIDDLPFVELTVGAVRTEMMFDSGGPLSISIPKSTVVTSGSVTLLPETAKFRDVQGKVFEVPMLMAKDIVIGHTILPPVKGRIHVQWGGTPEGADAALTHARESGAFGLAAFGDRPVMLDYAHATMTVYAPGEGPQPDDAGWHALPLEFGKEGPYVMLIVACKPLKFGLDTGTPFTLVKTDSLPSAMNGRCDLGASGKNCTNDSLTDVRDGSGYKLGERDAHPV